MGEQISVGEQSSVGEQRSVGEQSSVGWQAAAEENRSHRAEAGESSLGREGRLLYTLGPVLTPWPN